MRLKQPRRGSFAALKVFDRSACVRRASSAYGTTFERAGRAALVALQTASSIIRFQVLFGGREIFKRTARVAIRLPRTPSGTAQQTQLKLQATQQKHCRPPARPAQDKRCGDGQTDSKNMAGLTIVTLAVGDRSAAHHGHGRLVRRPSSGGADLGGLPAAGDDADGAGRIMQRHERPRAAECGVRAARLVTSTSIRRFVRRRPTSAE